MWSVLAVVIIGFIALIDLTRDSTLLQYSRYTIFAAPALCALVAGIEWPRRSHVIALAVVACLGMVNAALVYRPPAARQDFRQLAEIIDTRSTPGELLVFYNESDWLSPGMWYVGYKYYSPSSAHPWVALRHPPGAELRAQMQSRQTFWLIGRTPELFGPIIFPGWQPVAVWRTTAGGVCLMRNSHSDSQRDFQRDPPQ
jgi:hypothetical protein